MRQRVNIPLLHIPVYLAAVMLLLHVSICARAQYNDLPAGDTRQFTLPSFADSLHASSAGALSHMHPDTLLRIADSSLGQGLYAHTIQYALHVLDHQEKERRIDHRTVIAHNLAGLAYARLGNINLAIRNFLKAAEYARQLDHPGVSSSDIYNNLGTVMPDKMLALQYFGKAYEHAAAEKNTRIMGMALQNQSLLYESIGDLEQADKAIRQSQELGERHGDTLLIYVAQMRWCNSYLKRGQPLRALEHIATADRLLASARLDKYQAILHQHMKGEVYSMLGRHRDAEVHYLDALQLAREQKNIPQEVVNVKALSQLYEQVHNPASSLLYLKEYTRLKDSLLNERISQGVSSLEVQYRILEKDRELAREKAAVAKRDMLLLALAISCMLLAVILYYSYRHMRQKRKMLAQEKEIDHLKAIMEGEEQERLRIARELHDGIMVQFASVRMHMNSLYDEYGATVPESARLQEIIDHLDGATRELRRSAHNLMPDMLLAEGLTGALQYFCASASKSGHVRIKFQHYGPTPPIGTPFQLMLYRIAQELIQNALKHARAQQVLVQLDVTDKLVTLTIEDDGTGMAPPDPYHKEGSGLRGIRERIASLNGTMDIDSVPDVGTTIYIELELSILQAESPQKHAYIRSNS